jgi:hypothetical protein
MNIKSLNARAIIQSFIPEVHLTLSQQQVHLGAPHFRAFSSGLKMDAKFAPAKRVAGQKQDVWSIVNEAAAASPKQPIGKYSVPSTIECHPDRDK